MHNQKSHKPLESTSAILIINCGSSSVKFSLIEPESGVNILSGLAECLSTPQASIKIKHSINDENEMQSEHSCPVITF